MALASKDSKPEDFNRPGHIFPLKYRKGGVLKRAGHTEASMDLTMLAGLEPVGVLCEVVDDDGSMARLPKLRQFAQTNEIKIISIADLIRSVKYVLCIYFNEGYDIEQCVLGMMLYYNYVGKYFHCL